MAVINLFFRVAEALSEHLWSMGGSRSMPYVIVSEIEELLEMLGCLVIVFGLIRFHKHDPKVTVAELSFH